MVQGIDKMHGGMQARVQTASPHDQTPSVLCLAWHPLGHLLCSGSGDHYIRFWCRSRPGDPWWVKEDVRLSQSAPLEGKHQALDSGSR